jgi:hypothetical protein
MYILTLYIFKAVTEILYMFAFYSSDSVAAKV